MAKYSRRQLLVGAGRFGAFLTVFELARKSFGLVEQHNTWELAAKGNDHFLAHNAERVRNLTIGGSFAPEQWPLDAEGHQQAMAALDVAVRELDLKQMRLGLRWSRVHSDSGPDLAPYRDVLDYCLGHGVEVCLNPGPIRTFRWPEEHVPDGIQAMLGELPPAGATITQEMPLAQASLDYVDKLMATLKREYSTSDLSAIKMLQVENEPYYPLGEHEWILGSAYLQEVSHRLHVAFPDADIMITTAGRLNMKVIRDILFALKRSDASYEGKLVSGFDFHYRTPNRDSYPVIRYFDQITYARPGVGGTDDNILDSREVGYRIEVTEGQMEPYGHFQQPGNSSTDLRYMLQRCFDHVLDPKAAALVRLWGVEELAKKMVAGELTDEHRRIIELVRTINDRGPAEVRGR
ncbi:MAG: hypothetical protein AB7P33_02430 [Dehalococcoidia bacterium]